MRGLSVSFEATVNYWNVYIPLCHPLVLEQSSFRKKAEESPSSFVKSIPSTCKSRQFVWLLQKSVLELTRGVRGQRRLAGSGAFCQPLESCWNPTDVHMLLTFGFLRACPFARLLRKNIVHCILSSGREERRVGHVLQ